MYTINTTAAKCEAHIAMNRSRLKSYSNNYYLKDSSNFEIELFNPHAHSVLAKIKMNGSYISNSGLVIKPGQRVFLSRYLDSNNSFLFETYDIESDNEVAKKAIENNGSIEIEFYYEVSNFIGKPFWVSSGSTLLGNTGNGIYYSHSGNINYTNDVTFTSINTNNFDSINTNMPIAGSLSNTSNGSNLMNVSSKIETGRIEKGGSTKQKFETDNGSYNVFYSELLAIKLLPASAKPIEVSEIRTYCTGCGTRMKKQTWKFCPNCGTKID